MKKTLTTLTLLTVLTACKHQTIYKLKSICAAYKDTTAVKISPYTSHIKAGDTVLVWHNDTVGSNYVIKEILK